MTLAVETGWQVWPELASYTESMAVLDDTERFTQFYQSCYNDALRFVSYHTTACDCEALVQEAFLLVWQHFQQEGELKKSWLYWTLRNKIGDFYRSAQRRVVVADSAIFSGRGATDSEVENTETRIEVRRVLRKLSKEYREVLLLVFWSDLSRAEAAEALGISETNLKVRLLRARRAFLKEFERDATPSAVTSIKEVRSWIGQND